MSGFRLNRIENSRATKNAATHAANRVHKRCRTLVTQYIYIHDIFDVSEGITPTTHPYK
eukprot:COSAG05_NODE_653_length_8071_cov_220.994982_9_plen_59_part_00